MVFSRKSLLAALVGGVLLLAGGPWAEAASRAQLRFLSFVIRDQAPTADEAKAFRSGEKSIATLTDEWLSSPAHLQRIRRYFTDMFGVAADHEMVAWPFVLYMADETGVYYRDREGWPACSPEQAVVTEAWWLPAGGTVRVCPGELSTSLTTEGEGEDRGKKVACTSDRTLWSRGCGCGPKLIGCFPETLLDQLRQQVRGEFASQATLAFERGSSWFEVFATDRFYGTKLLYWKYLHAARMARGGELPTAGEWQVLASLDPNVWTQADYPGGQSLAGLVTAPGFLMQHNNYRVRIRALSEKLLCQPIGAPLNTGGISTFLNPNFTKEDLSHAGKEDCARCHYPMDNLGSLLFGWDTRGEWLGSIQEVSQVGHAFGRDGQGPRFLIRSFIERGPGFVQCMARTAWEDFSGSRWDDLGATDQQSLVSLAARGPRTLIHNMLRSTLLANLGVETDAPARPAGSGVPWSEVAPIFAAGCAGAACHSSGTFNTTYVDHERNVVRRGAAIVERITAKDGRAMPPSSAERKLTEGEIALIKRFLER